jgi:hypothetical protein
MHDEPGGQSPGVGAMQTHAQMGYQSGWLHLCTFMLTTYNTQVFSSNTRWRRWHGLLRRPVDAAVVDTRVAHISHQPVHVLQGEHILQSYVYSSQIVQEYERAVIFRLGRLVSGGARGPGTTRPVTPAFGDDVHI